MKTSLQILAQKLQTLTTFAEHFGITDEILTCVQSFHDEKDKMPVVVFYDCAWAFQTFGDHGWKPDYQSEGWQHAKRFAMGVEVKLYQAYRLDPQPEPGEINPALLTGREAGIELGPNAVRPVEAAL